MILKNGLYVRLVKKLIDDKLIFFDKSDKQHTNDKENAPLVAFAAQIFGEFNEYVLPPARFGGFAGVDSLIRYFEVFL